MHYNADMKERIGEVMSVVPWTELNLRDDEIKKYDNNTKNNNDK